jgi:hypothetical protein
MNLLEKLLNLPPFDRGKSYPDKSRLVRIEPPVWHDPVLRKLSWENDQRLAAARAPNDMQKETQPKTTNGLPPEAETHKLRRTLLLAGVFALLAMIYVPAPGKPPFSSAHYRFIFSQHETGIAFFQLLVNVAFAAILGALAANIPKRIFTWFRRCFLSKRAVIVYFIAIVIAGLVWVGAEQTRQQAIQEAERARQAEQARRQAEENEARHRQAEQARRQAEEQAVEQAKHAEIAEENVKRAKANQVLAEEAFRENRASLAHDYYRAAARCWTFAGRYDLAAECMEMADQIEWANPAAFPNAGESRPEWEAEEAQCREPLRYPPVKWDHQTEFGKTFAIIKFRERKGGRPQEGVRRIYESYRSTFLQAMEQGKPGWRGLG